MERKMKMTHSLYSRMTLISKIDRGFLALVQIFVGLECVVNDVIN